MKEITIKEIVEITNGTLLCGSEEMTITDLSTDSRKMGQGILFVPIIGERVDGHQFIKNALKKGGATLTQEHDNMEDIYPWIRVENTLEAMQKIAAWYRKKMTFPVVAVTGSVGKTTTRELISRALEAEFSVFHTEGNYNSQVGVPMTIARMRGEEEVAVLEAGMSQKGEMAALERMIVPDIVVFTNIGVAHIENLGTQDNICLEKMELAHHMSPNGVVFLNGDDQILMKYSKRIPCRIITYGFSEYCDYRAEQVSVGKGETRFQCIRNGKRYPVTMDVLGKHNVLNVLAAIGVSEYLGLSIEQVVPQFKNFKGLRQQVYEASDYTVIDDTYNASPDSMKAALAVLADMQTKGRKIAVLADMLELGDRSVIFHEEVGRYAAAKNLDELYVYGALSKNILEKAQKVNPSVKGKAFEKREDLETFLDGYFKKGDCILFKGSNGMKLSEIASKYHG